MPSSELSTYVRYAKTLKGYEPILAKARVSFPVVKALVAAEPEARQEIIERMTIGARIDDREVAAIRKRLREAKLTPSQIRGHRNRRLVTAAARVQITELQGGFAADFKTVLIPGNGAGIGIESADGSAELSVWGNYLTEGGFSQESALRRKFRADDGWKFTYEKHGASWASYSGTKGDRIIYMRQIALCDDAMGNVTIEYPAAQQRRFGPLIERVVKSLRAPHHCE